MSYSVVLDHQVDFSGWRDAARNLIAGNIPPGEVLWSVGQSEDLLAGGLPPSGPARTINVPKAFMPLAETVIQAREPQRFALLYTMLWRISCGERGLIDIASDRDTMRARLLAKSVRHDTHKMRAFLRFREVAGETGSHYVAWFEPEHYVVEANAGFFQRRFGSMHWFILTPYRSLHWDGESLLTAAGADRSLLPEDDAFGTYWNAYFSSIFNPARLKTKTMETHMPRKYWKNMPETALLPALTKAAGKRTETMIQNSLHEASSLSET